MTSPIDALVLNARQRQALVTIRSLGRRGLAVAAVDSMPDVPAFRSRWCRRHYVCPAADGAPSSMAYLEELLGRVEAAVLIPAHDGTIGVLRQHRSRLAARAAIALASEPALAVAVSKQRTLALARQLGINVPRSLSVTSVGEVPAALEEIGLPAVVKPTESWLSDGQAGEWIGPELVTTPDEARRAVAKVERLAGVALFQHLLSGRREAVSFLYANDEIHARFAQWAKRMNPPLGGESVLRQSIPIPPDIGRAAERLVREIGLEGYSEVEFRRDAGGVARLMEINPRLSASVGIAVRCGVDFPYLLYQWANGGPIDRISGYRVGRWVRYLRGDWVATLRALEQRGRPGVPTPLRAALSFGLSFLRPMGYDYVDWQDPAPAVRAMTDFAREIAGTAGRVTRRTVLGVLKRVALTSEAT